MTSTDRTAAGYTFALADREADREAVVALWRNYLATATRVDEKFQWFYCDAPAGEQALMFLQHGPESKRVGVAGIGGRNMFAHGKHISAGVLADFVVEPAHRSLLPAMLLQQQVRDVGLNGRALLYGAPNSKSLPVVRRLKYEHVGDLVRFAGVVRSRKYLLNKVPEVVASVGGGILDRARTLFYRPHTTMLGSWRSEWIDAPDARFDELWKRATAFDGLIGARDQRFLAWRFGSHPGHKYRILALTNSRFDGRILGYAVCETTAEALAIRDLLVDPDVDEPALRVLVHLIAREAYRKGFVRYSCEILAPPRIYNILESAGMAEREERLPLYVSFSPKQRQLRGAMWYMTRADFDV